MPQGITNNKRSPTDQISPNSYCGKDLFKILIDKKLIDIKSINDNQFKAYCHDTKTIKMFDIAKVFDIKKVGKQENWQTKLF